MKSDGGHITLEMLWEVRIKARLLSDEEFAHFAACDRCISICGICLISRSLEEAERRLREQAE
jgi:hypothetical protein